MHFFDQIQRMEAVQTVIVGSSTYPEDKDLLEELKDRGVIIITGYIKNIEELYQCSDCYLFPVLSEDACIEVPLSVFEAMACNLSVVTTKYGGLPNLVPEQDGIMYAESTGDFESKIKLIKGNSNPRTRKIVEHYSWTRVVKSALAASFVR
jgi:glycosyltransferase involved in cell wall biosynthesis